MVVGDAFAFEVLRQDVIVSAVEIDACIRQFALQGFVVDMHFFHLREQLVGKLSQLA